MPSRTLLKPKRVKVMKEDIDPQTLEEKTMRLLEHKAVQIEEASEEEEAVITVDVEGMMAAVATIEAAVAAMKVATEDVAATRVAMEDVVATKVATVVEEVIREAMVAVVDTKTRINFMKEDIREVAAAVDIMAAMVSMESLLEQHLLEDRENKAIMNFVEAEADTISVAVVMAQISNGNIKSLKEVKPKTNDSTSKFVTEILSRSLEDQDLGGHWPFHLSSPALYDTRSNLYF